MFRSVSASCRFLLHALQLRIPCQMERSHRTLLSVALVQSIAIVMTTGPFVTPIPYRHREKPGNDVSNLARNERSGV
jgi:hypothetical protein